MRDRGVWIGPSIMTADLLSLGAQIADAVAAGVDFVHLDVMDGRFVPNISFGLPMAEAMRAAASVPLDVHLMIVEPEKYVERFIAAGADSVTVHVEASTHLHGTLQSIAQAGGIPGVAINPGTSLTAIEEVLPVVGQILIMSVNPGFGGQRFIPASLAKIRRLRVLLDEVNPTCRLQVDGGIKASNIAHVVSAGADSIVAGSGIFSPGLSVLEAVNALRDAIQEAT